MSQNLVNHNKSSNVYNVVEELQDYMFTNNNFTRYIKDVYSSSYSVKQKYTRDDTSIKSNIQQDVKLNIVSSTKTNTKNNNNTQYVNKYDTNIYKPLKKDSLFWCFYILKYGFAKYEMEVGSQHFSIEKNEKYSNIDLLRAKENKDLLKINKIKPLSDLENDLANNEKISIKTFFALCIIEKMNILLVDGQKIYQSINNDSPLINVIHRNSKTYEHYIELNVSEKTIANFRENYYNVSNFDSALKSISSYKVDELLDLCKKLNITSLLETLTNTKAKKLTKKDIYELIVQNF